MGGAGAFKTLDCSLLGWVRKKSAEMSDSEEKSDTAEALSTLCKLWLGDIWDRMGLDGEAAEGRERTAIKVSQLVIQEFFE